jgi:hypothetical protein
MRSFRTWLANLLISFASFIRPDELPVKDKVGLGGPGAADR